MSLQPPDQGWETTGRHCTPKRRERRAIGSTRCTTRCIAGTFWSMPTNAAGPTRAQREWTARRSRTSRRTGLDAWLEELAEELQAEDVSTASRCGGYGSRRRTANNDRWGFRRSAIAWCRWRRCWSSNRSSRPTCSRNNMPTVPERSASGRRARRSRRCLDAGYTEVVDADLSGYFDSIPHAELMKSVARRISDRHLLHLIKMWLEAPVEETDERGRTQRTTRNKDEGRGTPQGGVALAAVGESVHASVHSGLEAVWGTSSGWTRTSSTMRTTS